MRHLFEIELLLRRQLDEVVKWHRNSFDAHACSEFVRLVSVQHYTNFKLWHQEDRARDPEASDSTVAEIKRTIDRLNQIVLLYARLHGRSIFKRLQILAEFA